MSSLRPSRRPAPALPTSSRLVRILGKTNFSGFGGRNRKCAEAFVKTGKPFNVLEAELLNGQKLQGTETAREVCQFLTERKRLDGYPLFKTIYRIAYEGLEPSKLTAEL